MNAQECPTAPNESNVFSMHNPAQTGLSPLKFLRDLGVEEAEEVRMAGYVTEPGNRSLAVAAR